MVVKGTVGEEGRERERRGKWKGQKRDVLGPFSLQ